jgi:hypothetical protein
MSSTPLKRKSWLRTRTQIKPASLKRMDEAEAYQLLRECLVLAPGSRCVVCGVAEPSVLHHRRPMGNGGAYTNPDNVIPVDTFCHALVHSPFEREWAVASGFLVVEGCAEFESLGARAWRLR